MLLADHDLFAPSAAPQEPECAMQLCASAQSIEEIKTVLAGLKQVDAPVEHIFTPGLYTRQIRMHAGSLIISKIHKRRHPFIISQGCCSVYTRENGWVTLTAPYTGITEPGTERVLLVHEDTIWTTFHVTDDTDLEKIEAHVIAKSMEEFRTFLEEDMKESLK